MVDRVRLVPSNEILAPSVNEDSPFPAREGGRGVRYEGIQLPLIPEDEIGGYTGSSRDRVPELTHYQDEGCRFWHACLSCPFPCCIFELPGGPSRAMHAFRDGEIRRLYAAGTSAVEIAGRFGVTRRSVYRILGGVRRRGGNGQWAMGNGDGRRKSRSHVPRRE
ncbi:MAG: helix-turn-helix domain-containing protein [Dehalococcoidia bacterium]